MTPIRVLILNDSTRFAGTEQHIVDLSTSLVDAGARVTVLCPVGSPIPGRLGALVRVVSLPPSGFSVRAMLHLRRRKSEHDIVHVHNGVCAIIAAAAGCRFVASQHFLSPARVGRAGLAGRLSRRLHVWVNRRVSRFIAISAAVAAQAIARGDCAPERIDTIHNGIPADLERKPAPPESAASLRVLCTARLEPEKDVAVLIDAMAKLRDAGVDVRCDIAGTGQLQSTLQHQIESRSLGDRVRLLGFCNDVAERMRQCDVLVLPSPAEPFGLVLLEAMREGRPVIAADAGGPREIVLHGETGLLFTAGVAHSLADRITALAADPTRRATMGRAGFDRLTTYFSSARMADQVLATYRRVLA